MAARPATRATLRDSIAEEWLCFIIVVLLVAPGNKLSPGKYDQATAPVSFGNRAGG
jgi:hypothetical protein